MGYQPGQIGVGARITVPVVSCRHTRYTYAALRVTTSTIYTHHACIDNERTALEKRHIIHQGAPMVREERLYSELQQLFPYLRRSYGCMSPQAVCSRYTGAKRAKYTRAFERLALRGLRTSDANVTMFLKDDKYIGSLVDKYPRCIQYRTAEYCASLAQYLLPIEHDVYDIEFNGHRVFAKGRNLVERATDILKLCQLYRYVYKGDHSKFDTHIQRGHLRAEHRFYKHLNRSKRLSWLLNLQLINKGRTRNGLKYRVLGTRCSGDLNTGLGNSLINWAIIRACAPRDCAIYLDGDDFLVFTNELVDWDFTPYGMVTDISLCDVGSIDFCSTRLVQFEEGPIMVRPPWRLLCKFGWLTRVRNERYHAKYVYSLGQCLDAIYSGVPIYGVLARRCLEIGMPKVVDTEFTWEAKHASSLRIASSPFNREAFARAFNLSPEQQLSIETSLAQLSLDCKRGIVDPQQYEPSEATEIYCTETAKTQEAWHQVRYECTCRCCSSR